MAKDDRDKATMDALPKKNGRPVIDTAFGPMNGAEKQQRYRLGKKSIQVDISDEEMNRITKYCLRYQVTKCDLIRDMIKKLRMTRPPDFN